MDSDRAINQVLHELRAIGDDPSRPSLTGGPIRPATYSSLGLRLWGSCDKRMWLRARGSCDKRMWLLAGLPTIGFGDILPPSGQAG